ncbi:MAG: M81 family metallopeptidase [Armatimonadetes bacterium]|nr:M81 family metallopeptidase [Armatimonadota bacterium]
MRIAIGQWRQETNTFNPRPTTLADYHRFGLTRDSARILAEYGQTDELGGFVRGLQAQAGVEIVPLLRAVAWSGGPLEDEAATRLRGYLREALEAAGQIDGVLLSLHGATAAHSTPDLAGAVLADVRKQVGRRVPLIATLDLHANVTPAMVAAADLLVGYRSNPHVDLIETGERAARLLLRLRSGEFKPTVALRKIPALIGAERQSTFEGPLAELTAELRNVERQGSALLAEMYPVQPWLDVPGLGSGVLVATDGDPVEANRLADHFATLLWQCRDRCGEGRLPPTEVARVVSAAKDLPVVISDGADSTNSGAPGDSMVLLRAFLDAGTPGPILISLVDPLAAVACSRAGIGAQLTLPVGGKMDPRTGPPVTLTGRVRACCDGRYQINGHGGNLAVDTGLSVAFECGDIILAITSHTFVGSHPKVYRSLGLDPATARAVVAKSPHGFRHDYGPFAGQIVLADCPGAATGDYRALRFTEAPRPLYPLEPLADPEPPAMAEWSVRARL